MTNMRQTPQFLYEKVYCARGDVENRIKELKDLHLDPQILLTRPTKKSRTLHDIGLCNRQAGGPLHTSVATAGRVRLFFVECYLTHS